MNQTLCTIANEMVDVAEDEIEKLDSCLLDEKLSNGSKKLKPENYHTYYYIASECVAVFVTRQYINLWYISLNISFFFDR